MDKKTPSSEKFHPETIWPTVEIAAELEHKLRYGASYVEGDTYTNSAPASKWMKREDELVIASILAAYIYLRQNPGADWKQKLEVAESKIPDENTQVIMSWLNDHSARALLPMHPPEPYGDPEWAWMPEHSDRANGPFPDRKSAIDAAMEECEPGDKFSIGTVKYADPRDYSNIDAIEIIEKMEELAGDDEYSFWDDQIFEPRPPGSVVKGDRESYEGPQRELTILLADWADRWFESSVWSMEIKENFTA